MSLKGFHILFLLLAFLCTAGFWGWVAYDVAAAEQLGIVTWGNLSGTLAIAILIYGTWFVAKKSKTIQV